MADDEKGGVGKKESKVIFNRLLKSGKMETQE